MAQDLAREEFVLPSNACFGCGEANSHGLQVSIYRDPDAPDCLLGEFLPGPDMIGLPGVTHGGAIYTAMDCMATWSGMVLKRTKAMWVLRSAATTYHRPAVEGAPISLSASLSPSMSAQRPRPNSPARTSSGAKAGTRHCSRVP